MSMLARVPRSRTTKDVDLASQKAADLAEAEKSLVGLVDVDLGDHLTFRLIRSTPTGLGENQPGLATRRYIFACIDVDHDTQIDTVHVDVVVVVRPPPVGRPEMVEPANRLHLRRPLVTHPYRLYPVADHMADKVCATMDANYPGGKRSSRVKDLVDLVVLAHTQAVVPDELRNAIAAERVISGIEPFGHFDIPDDWTRTYPTTAKGVPSAASFTAETAAALVASLVDPALDKSSNNGIWDPDNLAWVAATSGPSAAPARPQPTRNRRLGRSERYACLYYDICRSRNNGEAPNNYSGFLVPTQPRCRRGTVGLRTLDRRVSADRNDVAGEVDGRTGSSEIAAIFCGGAIGTLMRAALANAVVVDPPQWPWTTFAVNIVGAHLLDRVRGKLGVFGRARRSGEGAAYLRQPVRRAHGDRRYRRQPCRRRSHGILRWVGQSKSDPLSGSASSRRAA